MNSTLRPKTSLMHLGTTNIEIVLLNGGIPSPEAVARRILPWCVVDGRKRTERLNQAGVRDRRQQTADGRSTRQDQG